MLNKDGALTEFKLCRFGTGYGGRIQYQARGTDKGVEELVGQQAITSVPETTFHVLAT